eukprot:4339559-Prymnesium_polylepis.1
MRATVGPRTPCDVHTPTAVACGRDLRVFAVTVMAGTTVSRDTMWLITTPTVRNTTTTCLTSADDAARCTVEGVQLAKVANTKRASHCTPTLSGACIRSH